MPHIKHLFKLN